MTPLMILFVTFIIIVLGVGFVKFSEPSKMIAHITQLKIENERLKNKNDRLTDKLYNIQEKQRALEKYEYEKKIDQLEVEKELLKNKNDRLAEELLKVKATSKWIETAYNWLTSLLAGLKKNVENLLFNAISKKTMDYVSCL